MDTNGQWTSYVNWYYQCIAVSLEITKMAEVPILATIGAEFLGFAAADMSELLFTQEATALWCISWSFHARAH